MASVYFSIPLLRFDLLQRRQERTQRSYLAAIKTLATVRKLTVTASPTATTEAVGSGEARPPANHPRRGQESVAADATGPATERWRSGGGRKQARDGKSDERGSVAIQKGIRPEL